MLKRILIPLDGSSYAEDAVPVAARLARGAGGIVILLRVVSSEDGARRDTSTARQRLPAEPLAHHRPQGSPSADLARIAARPDLAGMSIVPVVRTGAAAEVILDVAGSFEADTIVLSHEQRAGIAGHAFAHAAERVAQRADVPVLLVSGQHTLTVDAPGGPRCGPRLLVPLDGSKLAETALLPAVQLLAALDDATRGTLHLVHVVPDHAQWRWAARYLARTAERLRAGALTGQPLSVTWSVLVHLDAAEALARVAQLGEDAAASVSWSIARDLETGPRDALAPANEPDVTAPSEGFACCDLIVMTTHGRSGLQRLALGSVAERVLHMTDLSVLLIHPSTERAPARALAQEPDVEQWRT